MNGHSFQHGSYYCSWCGITRAQARSRDCDENLIRYRAPRRGPGVITEAQYFGAKPHTESHQANAADLLRRRNDLRAEWMGATGKTCPIDPDTGTEVSGSRSGAGDGGFRLETATTGRILSSHKRGCGVDDYDPGDELDTWLDGFEVPMENGQPGGNTKLAGYGLYREHPGATPGWCHLQSIAPTSGKRTYFP